MHIKQQQLPGSYKRQTEMARNGEGKNVPSATMDEKAIIYQLLYTQRVVYVHSTDLNCHMVPPEAPYYAVKKKKISEVG